LKSLRTYVVVHWWFFTYAICKIINDIVQYCCFIGAAFSRFDFTGDCQYTVECVELFACTSDRERCTGTIEASTSRKPKPGLVLVLDRVYVNAVWLVSYSRDGCCSYGARRFCCDVTRRHYTAVASSVTSSSSSADSADNDARLSHELSARSERELCLYT